MNIKNVMCVACGLSGVALFFLSIILAYLSQNFSFVGVGGVMGFICLVFCFANINSSN